MTTSTSIPITTIIPMFTAIGDRSWEQFKELEQAFVNEYGVSVWEEVFNFRLLPALDKDSNRWLLVQWCASGINWIKNVA